MKITLIFTSEQDGGYSVSCHNVPGANSQGDTLEEARKNIKEAIDLVLDYKTQNEDDKNPYIPFYLYRGGSLKNEDEIEIEENQFTEEIDYEYRPIKQLIIFAVDHSGQTNAIWVDDEWAWNWLVWESIFNEPINSTGLPMGVYQSYWFIDPPTEDRFYDQVVLDQENIRILYMISTPL